MAARSPTHALHRLKIAGRVDADHLDRAPPRTVAWRRHPAARRSRVARVVPATAARLLVRRRTAAARQPGATPAPSTASASAHHGAGGGRQGRRVTTLPLAPRALHTVGHPPKGLQHTLVGVGTGRHATSTWPGNTDTSRRVDGERARDRVHQGRGMSCRSIPDSHARPRVPTACRWCRSAPSEAARDHSR